MTSDETVNGAIDDLKSIGKLMTKKSDSDARLKNLGLMSRLVLLEAIFCCVVHRDGVKPRVYDGIRLNLNEMIDAYVKTSSNSKFCKMLESLRN
jgi:hypothetical protein